MWIWDCRHTKSSAVYTKSSSMTAYNTLIIRVGLTIAQYNPLATHFLWCIFGWDKQLVNESQIPVHNLYPLTIVRYLSHSRLILIAEKTTVYDEFPTPLINRLEKHFVLYSSVLEGWQVDTLEQLEEWIEEFSHVRRQIDYTLSEIYTQFLCVLFSFKEKDAFVGYQKDVAAAVVFQASSQLRKMCGRWQEEEDTGRHQLWEAAWESGLLGGCSLDKLADEKKGSESWKEAVRLLLFSCTHVQHLYSVIFR